MAKTPRRGSSLTLAALLAFGLAPSRSALAQTPSEIASARQWFAEGLTREESGEYARALELFQRAVQVKRTPQIAYHVAFCESRTGALVEALVDLDNAANLARAAHADDVVAAAQAELQDVKKRIPTLDVRVPPGVTASRLVVDGNVISLAMLGSGMPLDPGTHSVRIEFATGTQATKTATLVERDTKTLELAPPAATTPLVPAPIVVAPVLVAPLPPPPPPAPDEAPVHPTTHSKLPWVATVSGGAIFAAGVVFFVDGRVKEGSVHDQCATRTNCPPSLEGPYDTAKTFNAVGLALGAVGLVAAGTGVTLLVLRPSATTTAAIEVAPGHVGAALTF